MSGLRDLYQEVIFDHNRNPRNFGRLENANRTAEGNNPLCGDQLKLYMLVDAPASSSPPSTCPPPALTSP